MNFVVNNLVWKLEFVNPFDAVLYRSNGSKTVGVTDRNTLTVYISNDLQGKFLHKVITHEIVHTAIYSYYIDLTIEQEEILADIIASFGREIFNIADDIFRRINLCYQTSF